MKGTYYDNEKTVVEEVTRPSDIHNYRWVRDLIGCGHMLVTTAGREIRPPAADGEAHCWGCGHVREIKPESRRLVHAAKLAAACRPLRGPKPPPKKPAPRINTVPAVGSTRRLRHLALMQWPGPYIAQRIDASVCWVGEVRCGDKLTVAAEMAARIKALCDEIGTTVGPKAAAATVARQKGWQPISMWRDVDDPDEKPRRAT